MRAILARRFFLIRRLGCGDAPREAPATNGGGGSRRARTRREEKEETPWFHGRPPLHPSQPHPRKRDVDERLLLGVTNIPAASLPTKVPYASISLRKDCRSMRGQFEIFYPTERCGPLAWILTGPKNLRGNESHCVWSSGRLYR